MDDPNDPYSKRELDEKIINLRELITSKHDDVMIKVNEVLAQAKYTNGKVRKLIIASVLIGGILVGQTFANLHDIISLVSNVL